MAFDAGEAFGDEGAEDIGEADPFEASGDEDVESEPEMDESEPEADYEAAESIDESSFDESEPGESIDEAAGVTVSPATQDRQRAQFWASRVGADQRREAQRAAAAQQSIASRLRSIQAGPRMPTYGAISPLQGGNVFTATVTATNRQTQLKIEPAPALSRDVNRLRAVLNSNEKRQSTGIAANSRAIAALTATQAAVVKRLSGEQVKSDRELAKRIVEGDTRIDKRITTELSGQKGMADKTAKRLYRLVRRDRLRRTWDGILLASAMPLFAAYGDRSDPFSRNNLILTGSLAGWLVGDELIDQVVGVGKSARGWSGAADMWSYVAPVGNAATAYLLLKDRQHERFVTNITTIAKGASKSDAIALPIAKDDVDDFAKLTAASPNSVTVVATLVSATAAADNTRVVRGEVVGGKLTLTLDAATADTVRVAWMVDTQPPKS